MALHAPRDLPPREAVYQQRQRWLKAGVFEGMIHDLRVLLLRLSKQERASDPTAAVLDSRTLGSTPESGSRGAYDGHKGKKGSKVHAAAVDTLGHLLALRVSPANEDDRKQVGKLCEEVQQASAENVELAYVDQGYTGEKASESASEHGIRLEVVKHEEAKRGFVLLPRRWVVEGDFAWASRFRRLVKDYQRLPETVAGLHFVAFACLFLQSRRAAYSSRVHNTLWAFGTTQARKEHDAAFEHELRGDGTVACGGRGDHRPGLRDLRREGARAESA